MPEAVGNCWEGLPDDALMAVRRLRGDKVFPPSDAWLGRSDIINDRAGPCAYACPG